MTEKKPDLDYKMTSFIFWPIKKLAEFNLNIYNYIRPKRFMIREILNKITVGLDYILSIIAGAIVCGWALFQYDNSGFKFWFFYILYLHILILIFYDIKDKFKYLFNKNEKQNNMGY